MKSSAAGQQTRPALKVETVEVLECYQSDADNVSLPLDSRSLLLSPPLDAQEDLLCTRINMEGGGGSGGGSSVAQFTTTTTLASGVLRDYSPLRNRSVWLVCCLVVQSFSTTLMSSFRFLVIAHPCTVVFLTALAGAGGFASSQSAMVMAQVISERACFERAKFDLYPARARSLEPLRIAEVAKHELAAGIRTAAVLAALSYMRLELEAGLSRGEAVGLSSAMFVTTILSVGLGVLSPVVLWKSKVSTAHSAALCQSLATLVAAATSCVFVSLMARLVNSGE